MGSYYCRACGKTGNASYPLKGSGWITFALLFFYLLPGIIYSIWRRSDRKATCTFCKSTDLIPSNSPNASIKLNRKNCPACNCSITEHAKKCPECGVSFEAPISDNPYQPYNYADTEVWKALQSNVRTAATRNDWRACRDAEFKCFDYLKQAGFLQDALGHLFITIYFDINNPNEKGKTPQFSPDEGVQVLSLLAKEVISIETKEDLSFQDLERIFTNSIKPLEPILGMFPVSKEDAWSLIRKSALEG